MGVTTVGTAGATTVGVVTTVGEVTTVGVERTRDVTGREAAETPAPAATPAAVMPAAVVPATVVPAAVMAVETTMETMVPTMEAVVPTTEAAATAWTRTETCRRHAHARDCSNRRNENFADFHFFTSFFLSLTWG